MNKKHLVVILLGLILLAGDFYYKIPKRITPIPPDAYEIKYDSSFVPEISFYTPSTGTEILSFYREALTPSGWVVCSNCVASDAYCGVDAYAVYQYRDTKQLFVIIIGPPVVPRLDANNIYVKVYPGEDVPIWLGCPSLG